MAQQSPWATLIGGVFLIGWSTTFYVPAETTPLVEVSGSLVNATTGWVRHTYKGRPWESPIVTLSLNTGRDIRFTGRLEGDTPTAQPVGALKNGTLVRARVDATGEIWELSAGDQSVVTLADTLARHHQYRLDRNLRCALLLLLGLAMSVFGIRGLKAGES